MKCLNPEIPESLKHSMRTNVGKALEASRSSEAAYKSLQSQNLSISMVLLEKRMNVVQVTVEDAGQKKKVEDGEEHSQCLTYRDSNMGIGDHTNSSCSYIAWSTES